MASMQRWLAVATALALAGHGGRCDGHGSPIVVHVAGGQLTVSGGLTDDRGYASWVYADADDEAVFIPGPNNQLITDLPGLQVFDMTPGQQILLEVLPRPDFTVATAPPRWLWYWNPTTEAVVDVPNDPQLEIASTRGFLPSVFLEQSSAPTNSTVLAANLQGADLGQHRHLLTYYLDNDPAAEFGAYGFFARLTSPDHVASEPFLVALNYAIDAATFQEGALDINAAARLPGDYDGDDDSDGDDFLAWQQTLGSTTALAADGSRNDVVDDGDLAVWAANYGRIVGTPARGAAMVVPEPAAGSVLGWVAAALFGSRRRKPAVRRKVTALSRKRR
jgi:hypothetical protein